MVDNLWAGTILQEPVGLTEGDYGDQQWPNCYGFIKAINIILRTFDKPDLLYFFTGIQCFI
jgi:hypothetical protein